MKKLTIPLAVFGFSSIVKRTMPTTGLPPKKTRLGFPHCNMISKFLTPIVSQAHYINVRDGSETLGVKLEGKQKC